MDNEKIYTIDYAACNDQEKKKFLASFGGASWFAIEPIERRPFTDCLYNVLVFTRCWNSLCSIYPDNIPSIVSIAMDKLWQWLNTNQTDSDFEQFGENYIAAMCNVINGDTTYLDTEEKKQFYQQHFTTNWNRSYDNFADVLGMLIDKILWNQNNAGECLDYLIEYCIDNEVEDMEQIPSKNSYKIPELEEQILKIHRSPTFCNVIAACQKDLKVAMSSISIQQLQEQYKTKYLFTPDDII